MAAPSWLQTNGSEFSQWPRLPGCRQFSGGSPRGRCRFCARGQVSELMTLGPVLPLHSAECELCPSFSLRWEAWVRTTCASTRGLARTIGSQSDGHLTQPVPFPLGPGPCTSPWTWYGLRCFVSPCPRARGDGRALVSRISTPREGPREAVVGTCQAG